MGLISNIKKAVSKNKASENASLNFPSVIDEGVKPVDVTAPKQEALKQEAPKQLEIKPLGITPAQEKVELPEDETLAPKELPELPGDGFFLHLYNEIKGGKLSDTDVTSKDLVKEMQDYWRNDESLIKHKSQAEQNKWAIERSMTEAMERLTLLEQQWKMGKIKLEKLKRDIEKIESEIASESNHFKQLVKKLKFHKEVSPDQYFRLFSGREIKSLNELLGALKIMDDESFRKHVNEQRNDFAVWVEQVLKEPEIANQIRGFHTRQELIDFLENNTKHELNV